MVETDRPVGPLAFSASFPAEERFASTAASLAARLAGSSGCADAEATAIRADVEAAFRAGLARGTAEDSTIELSLRASESSFDADVTCGRVALLHCTRPLSA
jgi:hypothetical protein